MLRPETQEGGCFGLDPSGFEIPRVRLQGGCPHQAVRSRDDRGIDRELGTMPHGQAIGDWRGQGERREHTAHGPHKVLLARAAAHETQDRGEKGASRRRAHHKRKRQRVGTHARFLLRPELAVGPVQHVSPQTRVEWGSMPVGPRLQLRQLQASGPQRLVVSGSEVAGLGEEQAVRLQHRRVGRAVEEGGDNTEVGFKHGVKLKGAADSPNRKHWKEVASVYGTTSALALLELKVSRFAIPDRAPSRSDPDRATLQPVAVALVPAKERALPDAGRGSLLLRRLRASAPATGLLAGRLLQRLEQKAGARWPLDLVMYGATSSDRAFCGTHISKSTGRDIFN
ncbi:hypothetical protein AK812_SmicGene19377 [Symbiodinium microadriaticum]|uniref:Uncharacterized protein n=1 Tax=Symbiodinium microadriaticum TaxID=2951 RepID=A0A1Q9DSR5_SYMMI|nr:hypothetical protein AK812_SmicGene19377 [Symbiodinium microadriaticum]